MTPTTTPYTEQQAVAAMKRIEKRWPKSLWLWAASGTLHVMKCDPDGTRAQKKPDKTPGESGRGYADASIDTIKIPCDGGDW